MPMIDCLIKRQKFQKKKHHGKAELGSIITYRSKY